MLTTLLLLACTPRLPATGDTGPSQTTGVIDTADTQVGDSGGSDCLLYRDQDSDGWGDESQTTDVCDASGYTDVAGDCDDQDAAVHPDAAEVCNSLDDDCDAGVDEGDVAPATWFQDLDADGYGTDTATAESCEQPEGFAKADDDCNDDDATVHPYADEVCDDVDQDCDAVVDEQALDAPTWYGDSDADGYGDAAAPTAACDAPADHVDDATDCDDAQASVHPGADEVCDDTDQDCDAAVDEDSVDAPAWYSDSDADGFGDALTATFTCDAPGGTVADATDCDDGVASVHPGAAETCDDTDQDCDGSVDEDPTDPDTWYADADGDGHGHAGTTTQSCDAPTHYVASSDDCDDADSGVNPSATETCDSVDQDCDSSVDEGVEITWFLDDDGDGYGETATGVTTCSAPSSDHTVVDGDCYDANADAYPGQTDYFDDERGDGSFDHDCDGTEEQEFTDFATCEESSSGGSFSCSGDDGWWDYYGYYTSADIPACGDGWYWQFDCEEQDLWGYDYCELVDYDYEYQTCR